MLSAECEALVARYSSLERDQLDQSAVLAQCIQQIVQRAGHRLEDGCDDHISKSAGTESRVEMWNRILSCAFMGARDGDAESRAVWAATWEEALSASGAGTKLSALLRTLPLLLPMVRTMLGELSWHRRAQAVQVLREIVEVLPADTLTAQLQRLSSESVALLTALLLSIPGQVWGGQAGVLEAVSALMAKCKGIISWSTSVDWATSSASPAASIAVLEFSLAAGNSYENEGDPSLISLQRLSSDKLMSSIISGMKSAFDSTSFAASNGAQEGTSAPRSWSLSIFGWALLLVHESRRASGAADAEYRLAAAHALSILPWSAAASSTSDGCAVFHLMLPVLCKQSNIPPYAKATDPSTSLASAEATTASASSAAEKQRNEAKGGNKRLLGSAALFGVRYRLKDESGHTASSNSSKARVRQTVGSAGTADVLATGADSPAHSPMDTADEGAGVAESVQEDCAAMEVGIGVEDNSNSMEVVVAEEQEGVAAESAMLSVGEETGDDSPSGGTSPAAHDSERLRHPPAYHIFYIECLLKGWPVVSTKSSATAAGPTTESRRETPSEHRQHHNQQQQRQHLVECAQHVLAWAQTVMRTEVWALRRAAVQLVGVVSSSSIVRSDSQTAAGGAVEPMDAVLSVLELGIEDQKFVKVREEVLKSLGRVLQAPAQRAAIDGREEWRARVREIIRRASTDSQPTILEAVAKVQNIWLS